MQQAHSLAARGLAWANLPHIGAKVARLRVVGLMHADGIGVVVDRNVNVAAYGLLNARACSTATGKQINYQLGRQCQYKLRGEHKSPERKKPAKGGQLVN